MRLKILGLVIIIIGIFFLCTLSAGQIFPLINYIDIPSLITVILVDTGIVLVSGARDKDKICKLMSRVALPVGLLISILSVIILLNHVNDVSLIGPNLAVACLAVLYSVIIKIGVEIMRV